MFFDFYPIIVLLCTAIPEALLAYLGCHLPLLPLAAFWLFMRLKVRRVILSASVVAAFLDSLWNHIFPYETLAIVLIAFVVFIWHNYADLHSLPPLIMGGILCGACSAISLAVQLLAEGYVRFPEAIAYWGRHTLLLIVQEAVLMPFIALVCNMFWPYGDGSGRRRR